METIGDWIKERELTFYGSLEEFKRAADWFIIHSQVNQPGERWNNHYNTHRTSGQVFFRPAGTSIEGWAEVIVAPGGKSLIRVYVKPDTWPVLRETWERLEGELRKQGWITESSQADLPKPILKDDNFVVHWKKQFTKEQLDERRQRIPFSITAQTVLDTLADIQRQTSDQLRYSIGEEKPFARLVYTLTVQSIKGLDIALANDVSGVAGWAYYHHSSFAQREAWRNLGQIVKRLIDLSLDTRAAELLIGEQGRDAFKDTDLSLSIDGQPIGDYVLRVLAWNPEILRQAVQEVIDAQNPITTTIVAPVNDNRADIEGWKEHISLDYRLIIDRWRDGYTAKEISEVEGIGQSAGTIRNVITGQRKRLAMIYGKEKANELIPYHRT